MSVDDLVFGLLDTSPAIGDPDLAARFRALTISWSRYDYHGPILAGATVDEILNQALSRGYRYCFIQSCGNIVCERWTLDDWQSRDFSSALAAWTSDHDFLVAGSIAGDAQRWYGLVPRLLLVDLETYARLGRPAFDEPCTGPLPLPKPVPSAANGRITALRPSGEEQSAAPVMPGWRFVAESLAAGLDVEEPGAEILQRTLWLEADCAAPREAFAQYLDHGIERYPDDAGSDALSNDQREFLDIVARQATQARRGVFLFNIESYDDIETPPDDFQRPVSSVYSVAAGFKPNRILQTHGFDEHTRVVYFDYSPNALQVKKCMVDEWDGADFPRFMRHLFESFPSPQTFYHLWDDLPPEDVDWNDVENVWQHELARWGGEAALAEHWQAYRRLPHEYVCCDIVADPSPLLERITRDANAVLWWSNAFFTMFGNWFYSLNDREARYNHFIERLATRNPALFLFGSDYNNTNVNFIQAGDYWNQYRRLGISCLEPGRLNQKELQNVATVYRISFFLGGPVPS